MKEPVQAQYSGAWRWQGAFREKKDPARRKDKLPVEEPQTGEQCKCGRDECGGRQSLVSRWGRRNRNQRGFVRPSARTGRRQTRGEDKSTSQGKKRPHAEAYTGELIYSVMRARDSQIQEYVFEECASTLFLQS